MECDTWHKFRHLPTHQLRRLIRIHGAAEWDAPDRMDHPLPVSSKGTWPFQLHPDAAVERQDLPGNTLRYIESAVAAVRDGSTEPREEDWIRLEQHAVPTS